MSSPAPTPTLLTGHSAPIAHLAAHPSNQHILATASEDGSARIWDLSAGRAVKAIRGFEEDVVSSAGPTSLQTISTWASQIAINEKGTHLAWCDDTGAVGVINLSTSKPHLFRRKHSNISATLTFRPNRPWEVLSGGYDSHSILWDFSRLSPISSLDLASPSTSAQQQTDPNAFSMSPPFVLSVATSADGRALALGAGDGSVWVSPQVKEGQGKEEGKGKREKEKGKGGFARLEDVRRVAGAHEGPVVAVAFSPTTLHLLTASLNILRIWPLPLPTPSDPPTRPAPPRTLTPSPLSKINALAITPSHLVVGGLTATGQGVAAVYPLAELLAHKEGEP